MSKGQPRIFLAPMEGVVDPVVRKLWCEIGGIDECVTEFFRVTFQLVPKKVFYRDYPELHSGGLTENGTLVSFQILGSHLDLMPANALRAIELGAPQIDLNFGCPARTVNKSDGGASLLKEPQRIYDVVHAVRKAVPVGIKVSAKIRLGFDSDENCIEIAQAAEEAGAAWLTVHGRTKLQAYKPPANWEAIGRINDVLKIPVVANGDIWSPEDYSRCKEITGCDWFMLGRGLVARPSLALEIKGLHEKWEFKKLFPYLFRFIAGSIEYRNEGYALQRTKQMTKLWAQTYPEAFELFQRIKRCQDLADLVAICREFEHLHINHIATTTNIVDGIRNNCTMPLIVPNIGS